jgi:hypothetical protein
MPELRKQLEKSIPKLTGTTDVLVIIPGNDGTPVSITHKNGKPVGTRKTGA